MLPLRSLGNELCETPFSDSSTVSWLGTFTLLPNRMDSILRVVDTYVPGGLVVGPVTRGYNNLK